jgi:hypothetical protein
MKTYNKSINFLAVFLLLIFFSCKGFLDKPPYGSITAENFYNSSEKLKAGLTSAYNPLGFYDFETALFTMGNIMTDDAEKGGSGVNDNPAIYELSRFRAISSNDICLKFWIVCYKGIYHCNVVLDQAKYAGNENDPLIKRLIAEAKFLRGFYYFHLVTTFGGVPMLNSVLNPTDLSLEKSSSDAIFDMIEKDFKDAAEVLPLKSVYASTELGRATQGAAYVMYAKTLLMRKKYALAETALEKVVSSNQYTLVDDYGKIWTKSFENSTESVFEIQHKNTNSGTLNDTEGSFIPYFGNSRKNGGYGFDCPTQDLLNEYEPGDPRMIYTLTFTGEILVGGDVLDNSEALFGYHNRKICLAVKERDNPFSDQGYNIRYLRYADVLLLYSEVLNENNKIQESLRYLNMVRDRARKTNPLDPRRMKQKYQIVPNLPDISVTEKNELRKSIWHERRVELGMEYHRKFDLIRQGRFGDIMRAYAVKYNSDKGVSFNDSYHNLCPIPSDEITRSNNKITQNPGY